MPAAAPTSTRAPASDPAQLALLNALSSTEQDLFFTAVADLSPAAAQDHLIAKHRIALSPAALELWLHQARQSRRLRDFEAFLSTLRADVAQAQAFCRLLDDSALLERANAFVLSCKLFEALQTGDRAAILDFAHALAAILPST